VAALYLTEQGSKLRKASGRLVVEKNGETLLEIPAYGIDRVLIFGAVQLSTQVISFLLESGIDVSFLSMNGKLKGKLVPVQSMNVFLRLAQYERFRDEEFKLKMAKSIIEAKMMNQRTLILRYQKNHPDVDFSGELGVISNSIESLPDQKAIASLMGLEGASSAAYFRCYSRMLSEEFMFVKRTRHPPLDPANALLSLGYVLVTNEISALMESAGFDPFLGFLHSIRYGRRSLPLDLIEEFRHPVVDGLVQTVINTGSIKIDDFHKEENGAVFLNKDSFKKFLASYEERLDKPFKYREEEAETSYRRLFRMQVENFEKAILNRTDYQPFLVR
jgi:CRISPR-associated protein Cas1